ncbi:MAG: acyl--CoA ligase [Rhodobacteraceae bacterium]|nr:acyl--CoA ligase [Paracoccaceae bacterium]
MASLFDQGPDTPCPAPFNMAAHVLALASSRGDKTALSVLYRDQCNNWTYSQLQAAVRGLGTGLLKAGLTPGQIVLMRLGNSADFPIAYLGAIAAGLVPVPTSAQLTTPEVARMIDDLVPAAILHDPKVPCPNHPNRLPLKALQAMFTLPPCDWHMGDPNRMGYIVYTSGTSGNPRAVAHAHRAIWARRMMIKGWYDLHVFDRLLHAGAFNWTYTLGTGLMDPWSVGATALIPAPGIEIDAIPALLRAHHATIFAAAPGVYRKMLQTNRPFDTPSLRHALSAGEKLSQPLRDQWGDATGTAIHEAYGMSECSTFISSSPAHPTTGHALGHPQTGRRVAIVDARGPVPVNTPGTIAIDQNDPGLMLGYLDAAEETRARMQGDWFLTGDIGQMDPTGQITYLGRNDDMMNPGGTRVSPLEVEATLAKYPGLSEIGVTQVEVKPGVNIIAAFYTAPAPLDEAPLRAYVEANLARYKQPRAFIHVPSLPTGANGKLHRSSLPAYFPAYFKANET